MNYKVKKSKTIFNGNVFDLKVDEIEYDSGNKGVREVAVHNGGAVVLPIDKNGEIIFVKQFRYPFQKFLIELPAGKLEIGEDPQYCAKRELTEETGYFSDNISKLGQIYTTPGFCTEILHIYLADELDYHEVNREEGEYGMEVKMYSLDKALMMIGEGTIVDAKTICGLQLYQIYRKNKVNEIT